MSGTSGAGLGAYRSGDHYGVIRGSDGESVVLTDGHCPRCRRRVTLAYTRAEGSRPVDRVVILGGLVELDPHRCARRRP